MVLQSSRAQVGIASENPRFPDRGQAAHML
jgi:hypothetical protein